MILLGNGKCVTLKDLSQYPNILQCLWMNSCDLSKYLIITVPNYTQFRLYGLFAYMDFSLIWTILFLYFGYMAF